MATSVVPSTAGKLNATPPPHAVNQKLTCSTAVLTELLRGAGPTIGSRAAAAAATTSPCPLFPTESEDYYCLSCYARCSGLSLLVGPHTRHDYLPFSDAVLYMPAALLRETQEVVRESEESFVKPWRMQDQQRAETLTYLLQLRQSKVSAAAQLMEELQQVDQQLLHLTEAKAVDLSNWRYQQRALRRKMEKLKSGADTLFASLRTDSRAPQSRSTQAAPSWQHSQQVAQKELAHVRSLLTQQLQQLEIDEAAAHQQLETWHRLLNAVPHGNSDEKEALTHTPEALYQPTGQTETFVYASPAPPPAQSTRVSNAIDQPSLHASNAEVVLLQHALHSINDGLRHRLLHAAAASLTSSSASSRLPSSSREGTTFSYSPYTPVVAAGVVTGDTINSSLPPLPDATPLREAKASFAPPLPAPAASSASHEGERLAVEFKSSPPPRQSARVMASSAVDMQVDDGEHLQRARWQSWRAQERAVKESLNAMLQSATASADNGTGTSPSSSPPSSSVEKSCGEYGAMAALRGPLNF
ncbi:hypothetical protein ABL78_4322 [Leptomonas seymouri]|uniref:Uncharacterized protein n=1 Tax=Leptomonas seymouri TaxID=5684 RepID=A0A0N1PBW8_LEPSE|nr:hypothetical protein ABL78_4322 [Leptomonas seymouri]|eukprot:KPI86593.1 hypothetical protein ABL78_4322 [Leptomonas seymouri]